VGGCSPGASQNVLFPAKAGRLLVQRLVHRHPARTARELAEQIQKMGISAVQSAAGPVIAEILLPQELERNARESV